MGAIQGTRLKLCLTQRTRALVLCDYNFCCSSTLTPQIPTSTLKPKLFCTKLVKNWTNWFSQLCLKQFCLILLLSCLLLVPVTCHLCPQIYSLILKLSIWNKPFSSDCHVQGKPLPIYCLHLLVRKTWEVWASLQRPEKLPLSHGSSSFLFYHDQNFSPWIQLLILCSLPFYPIYFLTTFKLVFSVPFKKYSLYYISISKIFLNISILLKTG